MACPINRQLITFGQYQELSIMIGDMQVDVEAGKEAGVKTCAVTYGIGRKEDVSPILLSVIWLNLKILFLKEYNLIQ